MSKPINVEAQRVHKVIAETASKVKVLSMLNSEFFDEIRKKDEAEIINHFGNHTGRLLCKQAYLEDRFVSVCVEDGIKMTPLDDEFITEEARQIALDLKANITKLVRVFSDREMQLKLKGVYNSTSQEFTAFIDQFQSLQELMTSKLNTPMEEVKAIAQSRKVLTTKTQKLQDLRDTKKEAYDKQIEDCSKSKELREAQKKILNEQITKENDNRFTSISDNMDIGIKSKEALLKQHEDNSSKLNAEIKRLTGSLTKVMKNNKDSELALRREYKKSHNAFADNMDQYDHEMKGQNREKDKYQAELDDTMADLNQMNEEYNMLMVERKKREEIAAIMQRKNDEQNAAMDKLVKASEFIQAHWRGMQERRLAEKTLKKGKKKRKGKKNK